MIQPIEPLAKRVPYIGPVTSTIGLAIDIKDIEFVRQTIGHRNLNSISSYVTVMDDEERKNRILNIKKVNTYTA